MATVFIYRCITKAMQFGAVCILLLFEKDDEKVYEEWSKGLAPERWHDN